MLHVHPENHRASRIVCNAFTHVSVSSLGTELNRNGKHPTLYGNAEGGKGMPLQPCGPLETSLRSKNNRMCLHKSRTITACQGSSDGWRFNMEQHSRPVKWYGSNKNTTMSLDSCTYSMGGDQIQYERI